ncbi:MAG TPA: Maf-like protein [Bacteroidaceae bacterium]|nr:Maf-like protein [Bacteroidaceae bacterium]
MLQLDPYNVILASNSPRRKELLSGLGIQYTVQTLPNIDESYPKDLSGADIPQYIAGQKASAYSEHMAEDDLIITADTVVILGDEVLGKPKDANDAYRMLRALSGQTHQVITGVCITTKKKKVTFSAQTDVTFVELTDDEITWYVDTYKPMDKAGSYGVQEWIGYIAVSSMNGSFYNVMGLPVQLLYHELKKFV